MTIRQQILAALQRVYDDMGFDDQLSADRVEKELFAAFPPTAIALTPSLGFDDLARQMGYVKGDDYEALKTKIKTLQDEIVEWKCASGLETSAGDPAGVTPKTMQEFWEKFEHEHSTCVKLEPGQIVVQRVDVEHAATFMLGTKAHIGIIADGVLIQPCDIRRNFIAALDASGGNNA
jgi:hypothetical protein